MDPLGGVWSQIRLDRDVKLSDKQACIQWCQQVGIIPQSIQCRKDRISCKMLPRADCKVFGYTWYCNKCRTRKSLGVGTPFEDAHIDIGRALVIALCFANGETYDSTIRACSYDGNPPNRHTVARWFDYFRSLTSDWADGYQNSSSKIGGPGKVVQIDEALIGRRKYHRGRMVTGQWVLGKIDESGDLRLEICPGNKRNREALIPLIERHVAPGSVLHTDEWGAYRVLGTMGYTHKTVCHKREFVASDGTHTQRIESTWRSMRRTFTKGGHRIDDITEHLIEYMWRRHCLRIEEDPFRMLIKLMRI